MSDPQTKTQKYLLWAMAIALGIWLIMSVTTEKYSPFRRTGGCPPRTGYNYLDAYEQEQYYLQYPYVYPTPQSYVTAWYADRRQEGIYENALKKQVEKQYLS